MSFSLLKLAGFIHLEYYEYIMRTFLWVVLFIDQLAILLIGSVKLNQFEMSEFAFKQQLAHHSGEQAKLRRLLFKLLPQVRLLQQVKLLLAVVVSVVLFSYLNNPALGGIYAALVILIIVMLSRLSMFQKVATQMFTRSLEVILKVTQILHPLWVIIGIPKRKELLQPGSLQEFTDQLRRLPSVVIDPQQRQRLESVLQSDQKIVRDIMTVKKQVVIVEPSATLGPIVLSDLQKSGHGYFPVATKKGEPEGVLTLGDVADLELAKQRTSVAEQMSSRIAWVEEETSLTELAQAFLQEKQYLVLVRNLNGEFSGIVTIADLMKNLVGIVKE